MFFERNVLTLPSVELYRAVEALSVIVAVGSGFKEETGASELEKSVTDGISMTRSDAHLQVKATGGAMKLSRLVSSFDSRRVFL